jgi:N utilization substance protein B
LSVAGPSRKQARRDALFLLYQMEVTDQSLDELIEGQKLREGYPPDDFTVTAVEGVRSELPGLDETLAAHAVGWSLDRVAPLERSILRLALWEMSSAVTPAEVAIDEAVRLAKRYATDDAGVFVNGILGAVQREREAARDDE